MKMRVRAMPEAFPSRAQLKRKAIIAEAIGMFGELGFNGVTVQAVAERSGISGPGLLYYFKTKEDLLVAALEEIQSREQAIMEPMVAAVKSAADRPMAWRTLLDLLDLMLRRMIANPSVARFVLVLQSEALEPGHVAYPWFREREGQLHTLLVNLLTPHVVDPVGSSRHLMAVMYGLAQLWLRHGMTFDIMRDWERALEHLGGFSRITPGDPK